jgi:hypothetical protein
MNLVDIVLVGKVKDEMNRLVKTHGGLGKSKAFMGRRSERSTMTIRTMHQGGTGPELAVNSKDQGRRGRT